MSSLRSKVIRLAHQNPEIRPYLLPLLRDRVAANKPKFKPGDIVRREDGSDPGSKVESQGVWDDFLGTYQYQVRTDGRRLWWNETSMVEDNSASTLSPSSSDKPSERQLLKAREIEEVVLDEMRKNQSRWAWLKELDDVQTKRLAQMVTDSLVKSAKKEIQQKKRLRLPLVINTMSEKLIREYTLAQSRVYAPLATD